jgi:hypothetical protein
MRDRHLRYQFVTVRRLRPRVVDSLGDAPIVMPDNRYNGFKMKMSVTWTSRKMAEPGDVGRDEDKTALAVIRNRDVPPTVEGGYRPATNDIVELVSGEKLFVMDAQPAFPRRRSIGSPDGGWDGWRLTLVDRQPTLSAATEYE